MKYIFTLLFLCWFGDLYAQQLFYTDNFVGGVTTGGYSPDYSSGGNGNFNLSIPPGSTIHKAFLMAGRHGPAANLTVTLNGVNHTFDNTNQVSPIFQSIYGGNSAVHAIDITSSLNPAVTAYNLSIPNVSGPSNRYQDFYLYVAYDNATLNSVSTAIYVNTQDFGTNLIWNLNTPFNFNTASNVGLSIFSGYVCDPQGDGETLTVNGTGLGTFGGPDFNSGICGGPIGSFSYQNGILTGLGDDNANAAVAGPDALSGITGLVTNASNVLNLLFVGNSSNAVWANIIVNSTNACPNVQASGATTICPGQSTPLGVSSGLTYNWSPAAGLSCTNCQNPVASPASTTNYQVIVTNTSGPTSCIDTAFVQVTVTPLPITQTSASICDGAVYNLPGGGTANSTGLYYDTLISVNGCDSIIETNLTVHLNPLPNLGPDIFVCGAVNNLMLDAGPGFATYLWDDASANQTRIVNAVGTFNVTVTNNFGCFGSDTINVLNDTTLQASFTLIPHLGCVKDTIECINNSTGATGYIWYFGDSQSSLLTNPTHVYQNQGNYNVTLIASLNGQCFDTAVVSINTNHDFTPLIYLNSAGTNVIDSTCVSIPLNALCSTFPSGMYIYDYAWGDGTHSITNNPFAQHLYTEPGIYPFVLTLTDTLGCQDSISRPVYVDGLAIGDFLASDSLVCVGEPILITDTMSPYTVHFEYDFADGLVLEDVSSPLHVYESENTYIVTLTTYNILCPSYSISHEIMVDGYPVINLGPDTTICPGITGTIVLGNIDNPSQVLNWSTGDVTNSISVTNSGYYWALASSANAHCKTTDSIHILRDCYLNIPNSFSPNDDGLNDYFIPRDLLGSGVISFRMNIYNRWGENIYSASSIDGRGWDGKYNGKLQNMGVYVYTIDVEFSNKIRKTFKGNVTLLK